MATQINLKRSSPEDISGPPKKPRATDLLDEKRKKVEEARARAAAIAANLGSGGAAVNRIPVGSVTRTPPVPALSAAEAAAKRLADMKARVAALTGKAAIPTPSTVTTTPSARFNDLTEQHEDTTVRSRGGLDVGLHPALLADSVESGTFARKQAIQPKFATTMANQRNDSLRQGKPEPKKLVEVSRPSAEENAKNPYFDPKLGGGAATYQKNRSAKALIFNQKGKYIEQANALRRQAHLEKIKKRIADAARRAGIEEEMDTDKAFLKDPPPDVEWWDQGICSTQSYDDVGTSRAKIDSSDSIITVYIQHPILIEPPIEKHIPEAKPLPLTQEEQKKVRRHRRTEELKEKQAKIRLGLEAAPPPKIKKSNMMKVLGDEAVKNPTAVEARVNREIQERADVHMQQNAERKLTKEQKHEKIASNQEKDLLKGVHCLVFRIENLSNYGHRFKINKNVEQHSLTGICILNPKFNLVIVEGGEWAIRKYKKLMLNRINWAETTGSNLSMHQENREGDDGGSSKMDETSDDAGENACTLVWEGELKVKSFRKWTTNKCASEGEVRKVLERNKMENYWTLAKGKISTS